MATGARQPQAQAPQREYAGLGRLKGGNCVAPSCVHWVTLGGADMASLRAVLGGGHPQQAARSDAVSYRCFQKPTPVRGLEVGVRGAGGLMLLDNREEAGGQPVIAL